MLWHFPIVIQVNEKKKNGIENSVQMKWFTEKENVWILLYFDAFVYKSFNLNCKRRRKIQKHLFDGLSAEWVRENVFVCAHVWMQQWNFKSTQCIRYSCTHTCAQCMQLFLSFRYCTQRIDNASLRFHN